MIEFAIVLFIDQMREKDGNRNKSIVGPSKLQLNSFGTPQTGPNSRENDVGLRFRGLGGSRVANEQERKYKTRTMKLGYFGDLSLTQKIDYMSFVLIAILYMIYNFIQFKQV